MGLCSMIHVICMSYVYHVCHVCHMYVDTMIKYHIFDMMFTISFSCMSYLHVHFPCTISISCMSYLHVALSISCMSYLYCTFYHVPYPYFIYTLSIPLSPLYLLLFLLLSLLTLSQNIQPSDDLLTTRYQRYIRQYKHQERFIGGMLRINAVAGLSDTCYCHVTSDMKPYVHVTTDMPIGIPAPSVDRVCGHCETRLSPMWWPSTNESGAFMCQACRWASKGDEMDIS